MEKVRIGVIGIGSMGSSHVIQLDEGKVPNAEMTAVCDIDPARLEWAKEFNPNILRYDDYKKLLADKVVDMVIIATPHYLHPVIGIDALEAGLHVLSEKPLGVYTKQAKEFVEKAEETGNKLVVMLNCRPEPYYKKIREMVQGGELGELKRTVWIITNWYRTQDYYDNGGWRATYSGEGGGVLINQCPHQLDLWQWIYGMPKRVRAFAKFGRYHDIEVEDEVTAYTEYEDGSTGVFITSTGEFPGTNRLEITGSKGKLVYENGKLLFYKLSMDEREYCFTATDGFGSIEYEVEEIIPEGRGRGHRDIIQNFCNHLQFGEELISPGRDGLNSLAISNAMVLSQWTNDWVEIPNDGEKYWELLQERIATSKPKKRVISKIADLSNTFNTKA